MTPSIIEIPPGQLLVPSAGQEMSPASGVLGILAEQPLPQGAGLPELPVPAPRAEVAGIQAGPAAFMPTTGTLPLTGGPPVLPLTTALLTIAGLGLWLTTMIRGRRY